MSLVSILLTSFALSMDAFAVSVTKGITIKNITKKTAIDDINNPTYFIFVPP